MRASVAIGVVLLALGGCGGKSQPPATAAQPAADPANPAALRCEPWPDGTEPPEGSRLLHSAEQSLPGTHSGFGSPVSVVVGDACVTLPAGESPARVYCGAAEASGAPRPCMVGEECAIGSIMVTDVARFEQPEGVATCATFENWSRTTPRSIYLWAKPR